MSDKPEEMIVTLDEAGGHVRLDLYLAGLEGGRSRSFWQKLIKDGKVKVNGKVAAMTRFMVTGGDRLDVEWPAEEGKNCLVPEDFRFPILFEDEEMLIIDKPVGVVVHPAPGNWTGTVVNALLGRDGNFAEEFESETEEGQARPGIVHRLDKDTSGCLIIAKNQLIATKLSGLFSRREVKKTYMALTYGYPPEDRGEIITLIGRHPGDRKKMAVLERVGREAVTQYEVERKGRIDGVRVALVRVKIMTGRTHQIRVHLAHLKAPVLGDLVYGGKQKLEAPRQMLHASVLKLIHPTTGVPLTVKAPYPADFAALLARLVVEAPTPPPSED